MVAVSMVMTIGAMMFGGLAHVAPHRRNRLAEQCRQHFLARADLPKPSLVHEHDLVDRSEQVRAVIDDHDGHLALPQPLDRIGERAIAVAIEICVRLVEHHQHRLAEQCAREPDALPLTARKTCAVIPDHGVIALGKTLDHHVRRRQLRCLDDLQAMLKKHGDWMLLGSADEQKPAAPGTVEAWGRDAGNPVGGWYGLKKGLRGRFANYVPPVMEALGLAEVEHNAKNNRMRAT